jgi:hypothetical protein
MIRKLLMVTAVVAMPLGMIAVTGGVANAAGINAKNDTVTCTGIKGTAKFSPTVTSNEKAGTTKTKITATLTGCTSNATGLTVKSGKVTGTLSDKHAAEDGCTGLAGSIPAIGKLTTKWTTTPAITSGNSVISVKSIDGGVGSDGNATFTIPGGTPNGPPSGSFEGTNDGASDATSAQTTTSASSILTTCDKSGLKSISIKSPQTPPAVFLG